MKMKVVLLAGACLAVCAGPVMAAGIDYLEQWDSYAVGTADPNYVANWPMIAGSNRYTIEDPTNPDDVWSGLNALKVPKEQKLGIAHDLTLDALSAGQSVEGTDAEPLLAEIIPWLNTTIGKLQYADIFVELSMGEVHAPDSDSATVLPVLAWGIVQGANGGTPTLDGKFFDGKNWNTAGPTEVGKAWNKLDMAVKTNTVDVSMAQKGSGSDSFVRQYLGGFDTISVRTIDNDQLGQTRYADDVSLKGGVIVPEPASLVLLGLGFVGLVLLARRRV